MISSEYDDLKRMAEIDPDDSHSDKELFAMIYEAQCEERPSEVELRDYVERNLQDRGFSSMSQLRWYLEGVKQVWAEVEATM